MKKFFKLIKRYPCTSYLTLFYCCIILNLISLFVFSYKGFNVMDETTESLYFMAFFFPIIAFLFSISIFLSVKSDILVCVVFFFSSFLMSVMVDYFIAYVISLSKVPPKGYDFNKF